METVNHEYYVSLEIAKLLKKAGFDWKCRGIYVLDSENDTEYVFSTANFTNTSKEIEGYIRLSAPTLDIVQRWLREVKDINIYVCPGFEPLEEQWKMRWQNAAITSNIDNDDMFLSNTEDNFYDTYEQAQEAAIKRTLEIMLEKGE